MLKYLELIASVFSRSGAEHNSAIKTKYCYLCKNNVQYFAPFKGGVESVSSFIRSLQVVGSDVENFYCPVCGCFDRERHLVMYFDKLNLWEKIKNKHVLHFAPEKHLSLLISRQDPSLYIKADLFPNSPEILKVDITSIPFKDQSFDVIICNHVLEHVTDDTLALSELFRVLKPGGIAVLQTPFSILLENSICDPRLNSNELRKYFYGQEDHVRVYGHDLFYKIRKAGFNLCIKTHSDILSEFNADLFAVNLREDLILVGKESYGVENNFSQNLCNNVGNLLDDYLKNHKVRCLHLGCGDHYLDGWLNSDFNANSGQVLILDATRPFPIALDLFDLIFSEHMIEHLSYLDGKNMLKECFRVLKSGGTIRIATPNLKFLIELYSNSRNELQNDYIEWAINNYVKYAPTKNPIFVLNNFVRDWGHKFIYDEETLSQLLMDAGFKNITKCKLNLSDNSRLCNLENDTRMPAGFLNLETIVLEGTKP